MSNVQLTRLKPGWYWAQDMTMPARPAYYNGVVLKDHPHSKDSLCWHWPTFRVLAMLPQPTDADMRGMQVILEENSK